MYFIIKHLCNYLRATSGLPGEGNSQPGRQYYVPFRGRRRGYFVGKSKTRIIMEEQCRWRESNPHSSRPERDFESRASANSATPARPLTIREVILIYKTPGRPKRGSPVGGNEDNSLRGQLEERGTVPLRGQSPRFGDSPPRRCLSPARSDIVSACRRPKGSKRSPESCHCASPTCASCSRV
jgi:hypothetical protein